MSALFPITRPYQSLFENFDLWSAATGNHGLIVAEEHRIGPDAASRHLDESEGLHFDTYHGFSRERMVEAEVFLTAAAQAGLFPKAGLFQEVPGGISLTPHYA